MVGCGRRTRGANPLELGALMLTSGLRAWVWQRLSAVYLGLFLIWLGLHLGLTPPPDFQSWRAWVGQPLISVAFVLFFLSLMLHVWVGIRDVVMDYVHPIGLRITVFILVLLLLSAMTAWAILLLAGLDHRTT